MSVQIALGAPGHPGGVAEAGAGGGQALVAGGQRSGGLRDQHVGQHVGQVRDRGHDAVVGLRVDRDRLGAEAVRAGGAGVRKHAGGGRRGGQVPGGALEQVGAGVLDPGGLGAGQRVAADKAGVVMGGDHGALGRADVGDHAVVGRCRQRLPHRRRHLSHRNGDEHRLGAGHRFGDGGAGLVQRSPPQARRQRLLGAVIAADRGSQALARGQGHGAADQTDADDRDLQTADSALPATAAAACTRSA